MTIDKLYKNIKNADNNIELILYNNQTLLHVMTYLLVTYGEMGITNQKTKFILKYIRSIISELFNNEIISANKFILIQLVDRLQKTAPGNKSYIDTSRQWELSFTPADYIEFYRNKILYTDYIDIKWGNLMQQEVAEIVDKRITESPLDNANLNNLSLNFSLTGLSWAILNDSYNAVE